MASVLRALSVGVFLVAQAAPAGSHDLSKGPLALHVAEVSSLQRMDALNLSPDARNAFFSIVRRDRVWPSREITVCFGPSDALAARQELVEKIISIANEWTLGTKVGFDWGAKPYRLCEASSSASIRVNISLPADDSAFFQSLVGNESRSSSIAGYYPYSMVLLFPDVSDYYNRSEVVRFYVLHEFGHALGFEHEHQRVDCDFDWNYVAKHFNFSSAQDAKDNMEKTFNSTIHAYPDNAAVIDGDFITTKYDNYSVMKYNLSTTSSPSGDDPGVYTDGKHSQCYRSGWVSQLTKFDRTGMAKAYGEPLIGIGAIAQNLNNLSALTGQGVRRRLTDPGLGRVDVMAAATEKRRRKPIPDSLLTDEQRDVRHDFEVLRQFPGAVNLVKRVLAERAQR